MPGLWGIREWQLEDLFPRGTNRPRTDPPPTPGPCGVALTRAGGQLCIMDVAQAEISVLDEIVLTESWARYRPAGELGVEEVSSHVSL